MVIAGIRLGGLSEKLLHLLEERKRRVRWNGEQKYKSLNLWEKRQSFRSSCNSRCMKRHRNTYEKKKRRKNSPYS